MQVQKVTEFIILYGKKYPKSLITYLLSKPTNEGKDVNNLTEKYLDEMKEVIKNNFIENGIKKGYITSFSPESVPLWMDIAETKGYKVVNIKHTSNGVQANVIKNNQSRKKQRTKPKIKICKCKR